ncbi:hypothetical protein MAPG_03444 [Magnaporthiopsis poae ATCC 64411]|uniref:Uncharacterized protein n=1 Tax=Magnaporthiopsis poae (strain ATCC 64411 / 73-15) TaxID=644358 RepID=A0A0C4DU12_MAGP6|nr:hypothetical protein MAPG_03444 [Magnaporthiopsis poae ATCC 64411]
MRPDSKVIHAKAVGTEAGVRRHQATGAGQHAGDRDGLQTVEMSELPVLGPGWAPTRVVPASAFFIGIYRPAKEKIRPGQRGEVENPRHHSTSRADIMPGLHPPRHLEGSR